jgi:hypothetical protein
MGFFAALLPFSAFIVLLSIFSSLPNIPHPSQHALNSSGLCSTAIWASGLRGILQEFVILLQAIFPIYLQKNSEYEKYKKIITTMTNIGAR